MNRILVIEDEDSIRETITDILKAENYSVFSAENGSDGLALAKDIQPDLILCDVMMPGLSGFEVLTRLRQESHSESTPFIFLTARSEKKSLREGMNLGADDYLTKPFTIDELLSAIKARLRYKEKSLLKARELESARRLQLSLLPADFPVIKYLDIHARLLTASEVGGDYYDFFPDGDNNGLICFTGDASGHGVTAGNMVITIKGMLNIMEGEPELSLILGDINRAIRKMNLKLLYMSLSLIRVRESSVEIASAGMPPVLLFRGDTHKTEYIFQKSMPAGGVKSFPYKTQKTGFNKGDILVSVSDGISEMFNENEEMFGYDRISEILNENHQESAGFLTGKILDSAMLWTGNAPLRDDMTIMVIKKTA
jgi:serine phosphatase RsbU (regulator of sigma subunit)